MTHKKIFKDLKSPIKKMETKLTDKIDFDDNLYNHRCELVNHLWIMEKKSLENFAIYGQHFGFSDDPLARLFNGLYIAVKAKDESVGYALLTILEAILSSSLELIPEYGDIFNN